MLPTGTTNLLVYLLTLFMGLATRQLTSVFEFSVHKLAGYFKHDIIKSFWS